MSKYRKKPIVVEAVQFQGFDSSNGRVMFDERPRWLTEKFGKSVVFFDKPNTLTIRTLEGDFRVDPGGYIIQGVQGELYPCKQDVFTQTYEAVSDEENDANYLSSF